MKLVYLSAATIGLSLMSMSVTQAALTHYQAKHNEDSIPEIFSNVYGGSFSSVGNDYTNGSVTAHRVTDTHDAVWGHQTYQAKTIARFSGYTQSFGTYSPQAGFQKKLEADNTFGYQANSDTVPITLDRGFCWGRSGNSGTQTSIIGSNLDGRDHMLTFRISGLSQSEPVWMLFWEDLNLSSSLSGNRSTSDFNDMVIQLTAGVGGQSGPGPVSVPLPPAMAACALTVGLGVAIRLKRRIFK